METNTIEAVPGIGPAENMAYDSEKEKNEISETEITSDPAENLRTEKTFTQKELDDIVRNRLERAKKDIPSKEELEEFRNWQSSHAEAEQKTANELAAAFSAKEAAENDRRILEIRVACLSKGISPEYADDVIALAERYSDEYYDSADRVSAKTLSGIQTQSLLSVITKYKSGELTMNQAVSIISAAMGISREKARRLAEGTE